MGSALLQPAANPSVCGAPACKMGQTLRPYPQYQNVDANSDFAGDSYYNSLQVTFEKRFSYGGAILAGYTWAKLISNAEGDAPYFELDTAGAGAIQDYTNLAAERSLAIHQSLDEILPADDTILSLSQKSILMLRSIEGVSSVLVGMRSDEYVDDVLYGLQAKK